MVLVPLMLYERASRCPGERVAARIMPIAVTSNIVRLVRPMASLRVWRDN